MTKSYYDSRQCEFFILIYNGSIFTHLKYTAPEPETPYLFCPWAGHWLSLLPLQQPLGVA